MRYDLAFAERMIRASLAQSDIARSDAVRAGNLDITFASAMKAFDEARVQFVLAGMRLENEGVDRNNILAAAGHGLGSAWANALNFALGARERDILNSWVRNGLAQQIGEQAATKTVGNLADNLVETEETQH